MELLPITAIIDILRGIIYDLSDNKMRFALGSVMGNSLAILAKKPDQFELSYFVRDIEAISNLKNTLQI